MRRLLLVMAVCVALLSMAACAKDKKVEKEPLVSSSTVVEQFNVHPKSDIASGLKVNDSKMKSDKKIKNADGDKKDSKPKSKKQD